jgi:hypothetical protein
MGEVRPALSPAKTASGGHPPGAKYSGVGRSPRAPGLWVTPRAGLRAAPLPRRHVRADAAAPDAYQGFPDTPGDF